MRWGWDVGEGEGEDRRGQEWRSGSWWGGDGGLGEGRWGDCVRMNKGRGKGEEREKRVLVQDVVHPAAGTRKMAVKGEDVHVGCRGISRARLSDRQRSCSWDFDNKPIAARARGALHDVDVGLQQQQPSARRSTPRASSVNSKRPGAVGVTEKSILARAGSPVVRGSHLTANSKRSPALQIYRDESLSRAVLSAGKTSSRPGSNKIAAVHSPVDAGIARRRSGDKTVAAKASPLSVKGARSSSIVHTASRMSTNPMKLSVKVEDEEDQAPELSTIQSSLHGRLSLLEGRVSQMAAELRETKELLDANNPISSKALLTDIHSKIVNIENCMTGSPAESTSAGAGTGRPGRLSSGRTDSTSLRERIILEKEGFKKALQSLSGTHRRDAVDGELVSQQSSSRRYPKDSPALESKLKSHYEKHTPGSRLSNGGSTVNVSGIHERPALDHSRQDIVSTHEHAEPIFEDYYSENPIQTIKPVKARGPSLHQKVVESRASLSEKLKEDRDLLCMKLAEFGGRERAEAIACDEGALVAAEFLTSLDGDRCFRKEVGKSLEVLKVPSKDRKSSLPLPESSGRGARDFTS